MEQLFTLHLVAAESGLRADLARIAASIGYRTELYASPDALFAHRPTEGVVVVSQGAIPRGAPAFIDRMNREGIWLPLLLAANQPRVEDIVAAIKGGALDYLPVPLPREKLIAVLGRVQEEAVAQSRARRKMIEARRVVGSLSKREREVLDLLAQGNSNKAIARELKISPRTVEIHRAKMMDKLGADHAAAAVRVRLEAQLEDRYQPQSPVQASVAFARTGTAEFRVS